MLKTDLDNWFRKSASGLYELYAEGSASARGEAIGRLTGELIIEQEDHFNEQIRKMVPSTFYLHFLKYFIRWFNRNLEKHIPSEYKEEIRGISEFASENYGYIGTKYQRILNYHAAHDIGHALQNLALVGCTSFGTWGEGAAGGPAGDGGGDKTAEGSAGTAAGMIIGRNFDFYAGDKFAEKKIVSFIKPDEGYKFMYVTWGGFMGVASGMNEKGLTVTINAAKSTIPRGSATPVSLVAREIVQYAGNIAEAIAIAKKRKMFVSESFLVGSAADNRAVIIEKTPRSMAVYDPQRSPILCANHFQSEGLSGSARNREQMAESASVYRFRRLQELLKQAGPHHTVQQTVDILRNRQGLAGADIGMGNEKALNQLIAHHSVVFEPQKLRVWVSTAPWQLGAYVAYDLPHVFSLGGMKEDREICQAGQAVGGGGHADGAGGEGCIGADPFLLSESFRNFEGYRALKHKLEDGADIDPYQLVAYNPAFYHAYVLAGDYCFKKEQLGEAASFYSKALTKEIATRKEEAYIRKQIKRCAG